MWIYTIGIHMLIVCFHFIDCVQTSPTYCAYQDDHLQNRGGVFLEKGYQRCDDTQVSNSCYTVWKDTTEPDGSKKRVIERQGCSNEDRSNCLATFCNQSNAIQSDKYPDGAFCCCHGNKCNEEADYEKKTFSPLAKPVRQNVWTEIRNSSPSTTVKGADNERNTICAYKMAQEDPDVGLGTVLPDGKSAECDANNFCFSFYTVDPVNKSVATIHIQGCWEDRDVRMNSCNTSQCLPTKYKYPRANNSHFCCCHGEMCNNNIATDYVPQVLSTTAANDPVFHPLHDPSYKVRTIIIAILSVFCVAVIILGLYLTYRFCIHNGHPSPNSHGNLEIPQSPAFDIDDLKISCLISKGHFSEVWKGSLNDQDIAVKMYTANYRKYYYDEKYIYSLPHMGHDNLLKFYGAEERLLQDGTVQYMLVLQYIPGGTLYNHLKHNTLDWYTMCKMSQSLAKGLAFLHTEMGSGENFKPVIAHRDINTRNVLLTADLSCVIADLGFCIATMGSKFIHRGHTANAEQTSLTDVGTLRYMAPELLDGAVNLRDCEASLKQIDIYAFGLIMWEISSRCSELYQGCPMPEFAPAFHAEVGAHPSFEDMQLLVSKNKARPKFPEVWKDYNPAIRALKETIEECWDQDAEARLTALCVEERIQEMKMLWTHDSRNKGVTPTINTALLSHVSHSNRTGYHGNGHTQWAGRSSTSDSTSPNVVAEGSTSALIINDIHDTNISRSDSVSTLPPTWQERQGSFSTSTVETILAQTPNQQVQSHPKSQNTNALKNQPIPPHQGRNPTVERNTHKRSDEELAVIGNNLLYGKDRVDGANIQSPLGNADNIFDSLTDSLETSLMQNDVLNHHRSPPITYLQNHVQSNTGSELPPKVVNNPNQHPQNTNLSINSPANHLNQSKGDMSKHKKAKEMGFFGHLVLLGKLALGGKFDSRKPVNCEPENVTQNSIENGLMYDSIGQNNPIFEPSQSVETEIRMTNSGPIVRPANLRAKQTNVSNREPDHSNLGRERRSENMELVCNGRVPQVPGSQSSSPVFNRQRGAPYSKSTSDLSPQKVAGQLKEDIEIEEEEEEEGEESKYVRPSTLALKGHNYSRKVRGQSGGSLNSLVTKKQTNQNMVNEVNTDSDETCLKEKHRHSEELERLVEPEQAEDGEEDDEEGKLESIKLRNKTPVLENGGRLSLYDDRLMSDRGTLLEGSAKLKKSSRSLQQFKSIDEHCVPVYKDCTC